LLWDFFAHHHMSFTSAPVEKASRERFSASLSDHPFLSNRSLENSGVTAPGTAYPAPPPVPAPPVPEQLLLQKEFCLPLSLPRTARDNGYPVYRVAGV